MNPPDETPALSWKPVPGFEGTYEVSDSGRIRRLAVPDAAGRPRRARELRPAVDAWGYERVNLCSGPQRKGAFVHAVVALAFIGPRPDGLVINHKDGQKRNNTPANLEYVSQKANDHHALAMGLKGIGERHGMAKLSAADIREIRSLRRQGQHAALIGQRFGIHVEHVRKIVRRKTWRSV